MIQARKRKGQGQEMLQARGHRRFPDLPRHLRALPSRSVRLTQGSVCPLGPLRRAHSYGRQWGLLGTFQRREGRPGRCGEHPLAEAPSVFVRV